MARTDVQNCFFLCACEPGCLVSTQQVCPPRPKKRNINIESLSAANAIKKVAEIFPACQTFLSGASHRNALQETRRRFRKIKSCTFDKRLRGARLVFFRVSASPRIPNSFAEALFSSVCKSEITVKGVFFSFFFLLLDAFRLGGEAEKLFLFQAPENVKGMLQESPFYSHKLRSLD